MSLLWSLQANAHRQRSVCVHMYTANRAKYVDANAYTAADTHTHTPGLSHMHGNCQEICLSRERTPAIPTPHPASRILAAQLPIFPVQ